jgi:hypothetical protein
MFSRLNTRLSDLLTALSSFLLFTASYKVNELFDSFMLFAAGVSLIYIPAGIKLLCLLIGGFPALTGLFLSSFYLNTILWPSLPTISSMYFSIIGVGSYAAAVWLVKYLLNIRHDLENIRYWHIIILSLTASIFNGFGQNFVYFTQGVSTRDELLSKSSAMAFGDFLGCFLIVMLFHICIRIAKRKG